MDRSEITRWARAAAHQESPQDLFERLYADAAARGIAEIPWADLRPNANLVAWLDRESLIGAGGHALVVGCGLGDDAEELARRGFRVTAFDISGSAIALARKRFPGSAVAYETADLMHAQAAWAGLFDFVLEAYTLQVMPVALRRKAMRCLAALVAPAGALLVIARGRAERDQLTDLPWPLARSELQPLPAHGLDEVSFEDYLDEESPAVRRFRVLYRRSA